MILDAQSGEGNPHASVAGSSLMTLLPEECRAPVETGLEQLRTNGWSWLDGQRLEVTLMCPDGTRQEAEIEFQIESDTPDPGLLCICRDGALRQKLEEEQRFLSALLFSQQRLTPDGIVIVSRNDEILFHNDRYVQVWNIPAEVMDAGSIEEVRKITATKVVDPDGIFREGFQRFDDSRDIAHDEIELRDGRMLARHSAPVFADDGEWLGRFWSYRDVTEFRGMQRQLREQSERLSALVENNQDIVLSLDASAVIVSANAAVSEVLGYEDRQIIGSSFKSLISPDGRTVFEDHIAAVMDGAPREVELTALRADGGEVRLRIKLIPITHVSDGQRFWVVATDVTAAREAEAEAQRARSAMERAQEIASLGSFEWDLRTNTLTWSPQMYAMLGLDPQSFQPSFEAFMELVAPDERDQLTVHMEQVLASQSSYATDLRVMRSDEDYRRLNYRVDSVRNDRGEPVAIAGTAIDITDRKQEEEALSHLVSLLEDKSRALEQTTAEQEAFIYSVSHDLRSPLISIQGLAEIIQQDYSQELDATANRYLERILANVRRLQSMLSGLLELSRIGRTEKGSRRDVDLHELVTEIIEEIADTPDGQRATIEIQNQLPVVQAHYSRMSQLFMNLLENSLKYTPKDRAPHVVVKSEPEDSGWLISLSDNGIGIPAEQRTSAVGMYSRLSGGQRLNPGGSGVGLAIVSRIIKTHGGDLRIESGEGEGTTISFTLR